MPNIKSAKKRVKVIEKKTLRNNMIKSGYKSAIKQRRQDRTLQWVIPATHTMRTI